MRGAGSANGAGGRESVRLAVDGLTLARLTAGEALEALGSSAQGLAAEEARGRRARYGANRIEAVSREPHWLALLREFSHFFAIVLWLAAALAFVAERYQPGEGMATLGYAIVGVILLNGGFSFWQTYRAERALAALRELLPLRVEVRRPAGVEVVDAQDLAPGDVVLLAEGAKVPADCRIIESWGLRVNLAALTGESLPQARSAEPDDADSPQQAHSLLLAGSVIVAGECSAVVFATGMNTAFGRIAHLTQTAGDAESPLQREIRRVSRFVAMLALALGAIFYLIGNAVGLSPWASFMFAIGIIVANVPEGLLPTVTLALAMATQRMARRNALVRHLPAVETLGSATVILTDKTGTLTQNRMTVRELFISGQHRAPGDVATPAPDIACLRRVARHCHSLKFPAGTPSGDPMEIALWEFAADGSACERRIAEIPFDAERRRMSVVTLSESGERRLWCKGAPEAVLPLCRHWRSAEGSRPLDAAAMDMLRQAQERMADRGLRVLALAWRALMPDETAAESELELCGLVGLEDPPRPDVQAAVRRCHEAGVRIIMITGDHPHTALALAREVGIVRGQAPMALTGEALREMDGVALARALESAEILFARVTPEQKMRVVEALRRKGEIVAVTGDGVNDAPALKSADIGIAMGKSGTDVAREAADIVLLDDHFATIVNAIEEGRAVYENIRKFLTYILTSNIPEIVPYLAFVLFRIPLPLTVIQILAVDLGTDILPALALGAEKPHRDVMRRPPRARSERLLSWPLLARAYLFLGPLEACAAMAAFFHVLQQGGWQGGMPLGAHDALYLQATTACLAAIVLAQMVNVFVCRHPLLPAWHYPLSENRLLLIALVIEATLLLLIVYTPPGHLLFGTAPLPIDAWLFALPFALLLGVAEEGRKWLIRRSARRR
jgi:sodium/potassium-transporting ATPase subunit alpha